MMRKIFFAAVALVLAAGFTSCSKEEGMTPDTKGVEVSFEIGEKASFDAGSRAVKTAWADGDQILFIFKPAGESEFKIAENSEENLLRIQYDGSKWNIQRNLTEAELTALGTEGTYSAIHHRVASGNNILSNYEYLKSCTLTNYIGGELLIHNNDATYTVVDGKLNLGTVNMRLGYKSGSTERQFQISIPGLPEGSWHLSVVKATYTTGPISGYKWGISHFGNKHPSGVSVTFRKDEGELGTWGTAAQAYSCGVRNGEDVSFAFNISQQNEDNREEFGSYKFVLYNWNTTDTYLYTTDRQYNESTGQYAITLEGGKAYKLAPFDGEAEKIKWKMISII